MTNYKEGENNSSSWKGNQNWFLLYGEENMKSQEKTEKENKWNQVRAEVDQISDPNGRPIDEEIKESVAILRVFGFNTSASCWGHLNRGRKAPWIEFGNEIPKELLKKVKRKKTLEFIYTNPQIKAFREKNLKEQKRMMDLLDEFYKGREAWEVSIDVRLTLLPYGIYGNAHLINSGIFLQEIRSKKERKERLKQYRKEMIAFTTFLKKQYFQN